MAGPPWRRWIDSFFRTQTRTITRRAPRRKPYVEELEGRIAPAQYIWSGLGADANWSTKENWIGPSGPGVDAPNPARGDDLIFPLGPSQLTPNNDFTNAVVSTLQFTGNNYTL